MQSHSLTNVRLAIGLIAENDAETLASTLSSVQKISETIYVVDRDSTDNTVTVARCFTDHLIPLREQTKSPLNKAKLRNILIDAVEKDQCADWLLWVNPGERFDLQTAEELLEFLAEKPDDHAVYMMILRRFGEINGSPSDKDEETIDLRLMPLNRGLHFTGVVGESLFAAASNLMLPISAAPGRILLPPKNANPEKNRKEAERNLALISEVENEGSPILEYYLSERAKANMVIGNFINAMRDFRRLLLSTNEQNLKLETYNNIYELMTKTPYQADDMTNFLISAMGDFPLDMQLLTCLGLHLQQIGKLELAVRTLETAIQHGRISLDVWHRLRIREMAVTTLSVVFRLQNDTQKAMEILETNLELVDDRDRICRPLLDLYIAELQEPSAIALAETIWGDMLLDQMKEVIGGACCAASGNWDMAAKPLANAYAAGCREPLCLRWYAVTLISLHRFAEAMRILEEWIALEPGNSEAHSLLYATKNPEQLVSLLSTIQSTGNRYDAPGETEIIETKIRVGTSNTDHAEAIKEMIGASGTFDLPHEVTSFAADTEPVV